MSLIEIFAVRMPVAEIVLRGTVVYWFLFLLFRFVLRRDVGQIGVADVLLLVLIADASQNAMAGGYATVTEGLILICTIAGWNWLFDWAAYRFPAVARFVDPPALLLVRDGRPVMENLDKQNLSMEELQSQLRQQGAEDITRVRRAYLESDGKVSVVLRRGNPGRAGQGEAR
jgi:uncharacterized membrane protein YcaP (DUF421 family)